MKPKDLFEIKRTFPNDPLVYSEIVTLEEILRPDYPLFYSPLGWIKELLKDNHEFLRLLYHSELVVIEIQFIGNTHDWVDRNYQVGYAHASGYHY